MIARRGAAVATLFGLSLSMFGAGSSHSSAQEPDWPARVVITNDDGIDDPGVLALARAFAEVAETYLVAPAVDRSGSSNFMSVLETQRLRVEARDVGDERIVAYAVEGYPADCVIFALTGLLRDNPPDLVISGINGGSNLGDAWFLSGTVGAARTAAYLGVPAIAVSGVDDADPRALRAVAAWVVELARSAAVRELEAPSYLSVSLPVVPPERITGVVPARRARGNLRLVTEAAGAEGSGAEIWALNLSSAPVQPDADSDIAALARGQIAIVAMRASEQDPDWSVAPGELPAWPGAER